MPFLVRRRKELGLGQAEVEQKVGISRATWSRTENGEVALGVDQLPKVVEVLQYGGGVLQLIGDTEEVVKKMKAGGITVYSERVVPSDEDTAQKKDVSGDKLVKGSFLLAAATLAL